MRIHSLQTLLSLSFVFCLINHAFALATYRQAIGDICHLAYQRTAIVRDRLYFMSGLYGIANGTNYQGNGEGSKNLYWIDLNTSFPAENAISQAYFKSSALPLDLTPRFHIQANAWAGSFFYDEESMYVYSGLDDGSSAWVPDSTLPRYNTTSEKWDTVVVDGGKFNVGDRLDGSYASAPGYGLGYYLGGSPNPPTPGLVAFNSSSPAQPTWNNYTNDPNSAVGQLNILQGSMLFVPMGDAGVLLQMGGFDSAKFHKPAFPAFGLDQISVYDIASNVWFSVGTTGDIPPATIGQCAAVAASPDKSSYQVIMYGGSSEEKVFNENIYVLTVPSFQWIRIGSSNNTNTELKQGNQIGRSQHRCMSYKDAQMIVLGGFVWEAGVTANGQTVNCSSYPAIRVLNTTSFEWMTAFDPGAKAAVAPQVSRLIGGGPNGGATVKSPPGGWNDTRLQAVFSKLTPTRLKQITPQSTPSQPSSSKLSPSHRTGVIAGSILGALLFLALILALILWHIHRRKRRATLSISKPYPASDDSTNHTSPTVFVDGGELDTPISRAELQCPHNPTVIKTELPGSPATRPEMVGSSHLPCELTGGRGTHAQELDSARQQTPVELPAGPASAATMGWSPWSPQRRGVAVDLQKALPASPGSILMTPPPMYEPRRREDMPAVVGSGTGTGKRRRVSEKDGGRFRSIVEDG